LNPSPDEFQLVPKVPADTLTEVFGPDAILAPGIDAPLKDKLSQHFRQPVELFPWIMLIVLTLFVAESFLANRFYHREDSAA
jgi:hypothetical protein